MTKNILKKYLLELHTFSIIHYSEVLLVIIKMVQRERSGLDISKYCIKAMKECVFVKYITAIQLQTNLLFVFFIPFFQICQANAIKSILNEFKETAFFNMKTLED